MAPPTTEPSLWRRLGWFILLWSAGVIVVGTLALILRLPMKLLG